jgi:phosphatidate phosphatase LPIN
LLISILAYGEVPGEAVMQPLLAQNEGGFMSYFKRSKPKKVDLLKIDVNKGRKTPKSSNNPNINEGVNSNEIIKQLEQIESKVMMEEAKEKQPEPVKLPIVGKRMSVLFKKSFNPNSDQLKKLGLKFGRNEIRFTVTSRFQGTHSLVTDLYLWESDSKIVISDVDGTITRSDVLGQLMPIFGKDWSHSGVTELFNNIEKNNYKVLYLTARAIGQSEQTKDYLRKLNQSTQI